VSGITDPELNLSNPKPAFGYRNVKDIVRDPSLYGVSGSRVNKPQTYNAIAQISWVEKGKLFLIDGH
jgi:hypothetical protein